MQEPPEAAQAMTAREEQVLPPLTEVGLLAVVAKVAKASVDGEREAWRTLWPRCVQSQTSPPRRVIYNNNKRRAASCGRRLRRFCSLGE